MSSPADLLVIAELSANAGKTVEQAIELVDAAVWAGADAIKVQCYSADRLTIDHDGPGFTIGESIWSGRRLYDLYKEAETPPEVVESVFSYCKRIGIACFASVFDKHDVDFVAQFNPPYFKIASFEAIDLPLIRYASSKGKPLIISTGMASASGIDEALVAASTSKVTLLHCISEYPAKAETYNLGRMSYLAQRFLVPVGLSDHSLSASLPAVAVGMGATVIEKHLCLNRELGGPDAEFSLEPHEFRAMAAACREARAALNIPKGAPEPHRGLRRSLYIVADIKAGEVFTEENVRSIRPGHGMAPKHLPSVLGRKAATDLKRGTPLADAHITH